MNQEKQIQIAVFLLRVVTGLLFLQNGGLKLFGFLFFAAYGAGKWNFYDIIKS